MFDVFIQVFQTIPYRIFRPSDVGTMLTTRATSFRSVDFPVCPSHETSLEFLPFVSPANVTALDLHPVHCLSTAQYPDPSSNMTPFPKAVHHQNKNSKLQTIPNPSKLIHLPNPSTQSSNPHLLRKQPQSPQSHPISTIPPLPPHPSRELQSPRTSVLSSWPVC